MIGIARDIAKGVAHLHNHNIYHRDLSARNILVKKGPDGVWICKVADFGLSRFSETSETTTKSDTGPLKWMVTNLLLLKNKKKKEAPLNDFVSFFFLGTGIVTGEKIQLQIGCLELWSHFVGSVDSTRAVSRLGLCSSSKVKPKNKKKM
jgi:serine/threonine protein kinase